jgi:hypothetical protein
VERLDLFLHGHPRAVAQSLLWKEARIESISLNYVNDYLRGKTPVVRTRYAASVRAGNRLQVRRLELYGTNCRTQFTKNG